MSDISVIKNTKSNKQKKNKNGSNPTGWLIKTCLERPVNRFRNGRRKRSRWNRIVLLHSAWLTEQPNHRGQKTKQKLSMHVHALQNILQKFRFLSCLGSCCWCFFWLSCFMYPLSHYMQTNRVTTCPNTPLLQPQEEFLLTNTSVF